MILQVISLLAGMACTGYVCFCAVKLILPDERLLAAQQRLGVESAVRSYKHWSLKALSPFYRMLVPRIQQIKMPRYRQQKKSTFVAAGISDQFDPDEFMALKFISAILLVLFIFLFSVQLKVMPSLTWILLGLLGGFFVPDYVLWDLRNKRQRAILRELPTVMDLLTLSVEAGLDFVAAISRVADYAKEGPLKEEFNQMLKELQVGVVRSDALRNLADRSQLPELSSFATILIQADQMGSSIGPVLRAQSDQLRVARFQKAEREGIKAMNKLLLPLIIFILPSVFIVILGPQICDIYYNQTWFKTLFGGGP